MTDLYEAFLSRLALQAEGVTPVTLYHAVRRFRYASSGQRDPLSVLRTGEGACTAKHILLRDLLRRTGVAAEVEIAEGDFGRCLPSSGPVPAELRALTDAGPIHDFHNYVAAELDGRRVLLDATWHDAVAAHGFDVNSDWTGQGDTRLALTPERRLGAVEDVASEKARLLEGMDPVERERRARFLALLSQWIKTLEPNRETSP